ncbi:unnamed protein product [Hermetia illucens]|uniref:E3 ubiquitin-protein ligase n=2 Tax=Hermetia illucens TaxID=343691 RepID=A0A7R8UZH8_HERIL|nr:unnamed protein product [Hermetia illucens]
MTYIQANFCNSMVDMDLFFLQICATQLRPHTFLTTTIDLFGVSDWLGMAPLTSPQELEQDSMLEGFLTFLATLVTSRTNLGNDEATQCIIEISALLATENKTHSQLLELMPERSGNVHTKNFEKFLKQLSVYRAPTSGSENLEQGLFTPIDDVWEKYYDPLHVLLRAVHRRDFQSSMDRFAEYVKSQNRMPKSGNLWPPFRLPRPVGKAFSDPCCILNSRVFHATALAIFHRAVHSHNVSEHLLALTVFLLEIAVDMNRKNSSDAIVECDRAGNYYRRSSREVPELLNCYPTDSLLENLKYVVSKVSLNPQEPHVSPANYNTATFDSDFEWDVSESETLPMLIDAGPNAGGDHQIVPSGMEVALPQDLSVVREDALVIRSNSQDEISERGSPIISTLALPPITLPESGMEVAIRRDLGLTNPDGNRGNSSYRTTQQRQNEMFSPTNNININGMLLPFQRVQPVAVPSRNLDVVPSNMLGSRRAFGSRSGGLGSGNSRKRTVDSAAIGLDTDTIIIEESILSLLLKLHSQLSGTLDSFSLDDEHQDNESTSEDSPMQNTGDLLFEAGPSSMYYSSQSHSRTRHNIRVTDSRIGDGPFFIGNLLKKIARQSEVCAQSIEEIRRNLWPDQREKQAEQKAREAKEKEERSKRAKERQQKLMQDFANKQKQFMEMASEDMDCCDDEEEDEFEQPREKEYDCIICNRTSASTESNPIGLVVLVESSGVLGHRRKTGERLPLALCNEDQEKLDRESRLATDFNRRTELLSLKFGEESWYLSNNMAYETGVHVQSCGHHVHLTCLDAYLNSLYPQQRQNLHVERGEFYCPVCRQLSNSVLPLSPQLDRPTPMIRSTQLPFEAIASELTVLIKENEKPPQTSTKLSEAMGRAMEDMTNITHRKSKRIPPTFRSLFLFVTSIARTNLEAEVIQRGGSLCSSNVVRYKPKRDCIVPLLHVLSVHVRVLVEWPLWRSWASLAGLPVTDSAPVPSHCRELIPSLLSDPIALLLKFILLAPLHLDQVYFTCIVKVMYNLLYYQIVVQLCTTLTDLECDEILSKYLNLPDVPINGVSNLGSAMAYVLINMNKCQHLRRECVHMEHGPSSVNMKSMEQQLQRLCLPYLRVAALLRHHLYRQDLPDISTSQLEFVRLVYYLELVTESMDWDSFNASKALCFIPGTERSVPNFWCKQLMGVRPPTDTIRELVMNQHVAWQQPKLLGLPKEYERLFTFYHERPCINCMKVPKESSICLLCGTIVCLKQNCCVENECCEAVRHTITCGGGIGIFLVVTSTYIIVIRGRRACLWGSLYLDDFDEEDRDLKRGKPLYLSEDRFNLLESQWLSHRFAHTKHTWVFHRDLL